MVVQRSSTDKASVTRVESGRAKRCRKQDFMAESNGMELNARCRS
jgi:hypothetical protein